MFSARMARSWFIDVILKMTEEHINEMRIPEMRIWALRTAVDTF